MRKTEKIRYIVTTIWLMILVINIGFLIYDPSIFGAIVVGFILGGVFIMILDNSIINMQERFIDDLVKFQKDWLKRLMKLIPLVEKAKRVTELTKIKRLKKK